MEKKRKRSARETKALASTQAAMADAIFAELFSIVPGGEIPYRLIRESYLYRSKQRLDRFHQQLMQGIPPEEYDEFKVQLKNNFSIDDYYSFLNYAVEDEEEEKTMLYARMLQGFATTPIARKTKVHILKVSRELNLDDFELIRSLYISNKFEFMGSQETQSQVNALTKSIDPLAELAVRKLIRFGFLSGEKPRPTEILSLMAELAYDHTDLTPESIGRKRQTEASAFPVVLFLCNALEERYVKLLIKLQQSLHGEGIQSQAMVPIRPYPPLLRMHVHVIVLCVGSQGSPVESARKYVGIENTAIVEILLPGGKRPMLPFTDVPIFEFIDDNAESQSLNSFKEAVIKEVKNMGLTRPY